MAVQWHVCEHAPTQSQQWLSAGASWAQQGKRRWCRGYVNGLFKQQQWLRLKKACGRQHTDQLQCCRDLSKGKRRPQTAGFLAHLLGTCLRISQHSCCVGFMLSSSGKETEGEWHTTLGLLERAEPGMETHPCNPSTWETEGSLRVQGQLELHSKLWAVTRATEQPWPEQRLWSVWYLKRKVLTWK